MQYTFFSFYKNMMSCFPKVKAQDNIFSLKWCLFYEDIFCYKLSRSLLSMKTSKEVFFFGLNDDKGGIPQ